MFVAVVDVQRNLLDLRAQAAARCQRQGLQQRQSTSGLYCLWPSSKPKPGQFGRLSFAAFEPMRSRLRWGIHPWRNPFMAVTHIGSTNNILEHRALRSTSISCELGGGARISRILYSL